MSGDVFSLGNAILAPTVGSLYNTSQYKQIMLVISHGFHGIENAVKQHNMSNNYYIDYKYNISNRYSYAKNLSELLL